jgi:hypothetical protein
VVVSQPKVDFTNSREAVFGCTASAHSVDCLRPGSGASTCEGNGKTMLSMGIWDRIGPGVCRWRQVYSADGGKTWAHDWVMHRRRVG